MRRKTNDQFKKEVFDLVGDEYTFLECYQGASTKIKVKHNKCGHTYEVTPTHFLTGERCSHCKSPKGELIITKILNNLNIRYEYQKTFDDLRDKDCLSYDFYIPSQSILIEYQGQQHYEPIDHFGGDNKFAIQKKHEKLKSDYAETHNYNLIAVPYTKDTLPKIKKYLLSRGLSRC